MNLPRPAPPAVPPASAPARWQYGLADLLFASVLVALGLLIAAPLNVIWLGERERSFEAVLAVHAALTAAACALALARAQRQREPGRDLRLFMLLYAACAWLLYAVWTRTPDGCVPVLGALSLPLGLLAWVRIQAKRCEGLRCEACAAAWLFILWGPALTAIFTGVLDSRGCYGNESAGIAACKTYAEAQDIYRRTDWDGNGVLEYAQTFSGRWSLYERNAGAGDLTLVDQAFARADLATGAAQPKAGYVFKILKAQGPDAPGGAKTYVLNGRMTAGYALVACPSEYDRRGRNTFIINNVGSVYQKDLGPRTREIVDAMTAFNPGPGWGLSE